MNDNQTIMRIVQEYKKLKLQLTSNVGSEEFQEEVMWNDGIQVTMKELLDPVDPEIRMLILKGYLD